MADEALLRRDLAWVVQSAENRGTSKAAIVKIARAYLTKINRKANR